MRCTFVGVIFQDAGDELMKVALCSARRARRCGGGVQVCELASRAWVKVGSFAPWVR